VIFIVSAILFAVGTLLVLRSVIAIAASLIVICYDLVKLAVCLVIAALAGLGLLAQWCVRLGRPKPEPVITINIYSGEDEEAPTVELPRESFRRLRG
jgi:hypothetical protein